MLLIGRNWNFMATIHLQHLCRILWGAVWFLNRPPFEAINQMANAKWPNGKYQMLKVTQFTLLKLPVKVGSKVHSLSLPLSFFLFLTLLQILNCVLLPTIVWAASTYAGNNYEVCFQKFAQKLHLQLEFLATMHRKFCFGSNANANFTTWSIMHCYTIL